MPASNRNHPTMTTTTTTTTTTPARSCLTSNSILTSTSTPPAYSSRRVPVLPVSPEQQRQRQYDHEPTLPPTLTEAEQGALLSHNDAGLGSRKRKRESESEYAAEEASQRQPTTSTKPACSDCARHGSSRRGAKKQLLLLQRQHKAKDETVDPSHGVEAQITGQNHTDESISRSAPTKRAQDLDVKPKSGDLIATTPSKKEGCYLVLNLAEKTIRGKLVGGPYANASKGERGKVNVKTCLVLDFEGKTIRGRSVVAKG